MYTVTYGSDSNRSAGDAAFDTFRSASVFFRRMIKSHPEAEMWLHQQQRWCLGLTLAHYEPWKGIPVKINRPK